MININEAIQRIRQAGSKNVRCVPMAGQPVMDGDYQIEILNDTWSPIVTGVKKKIAEDLIAQATNKVILG